MAKTAVFPIQIWKKKCGVSYLPEDRNYDLYQLACKVTARRFFPNFLNLDATFNRDDAWKENDPKRYMHEVATMGCRTRVFENRYGMQTSVGRGNLSFTTINIVKLAIECREIADKEQRIEQFFAKLDSMLDITAKAASRTCGISENGFCQTVSFADVISMGRLRAVEAERYHCFCYQSRCVGHRIYRIG